MMEAELSWFLENLKMIPLYYWRSLNDLAIEGGMDCRMELMIIAPTRFVNISSKYESRFNDLRMRDPLIQSLRVTAWRRRPRNRARQVRENKFSPQELIIEIAPLAIMAAESDQTTMKDVRSALNEATVIEIHFLKSIFSFGTFPEHRIPMALDLRQSLLPGSIFCAVFIFIYIALTGPFIVLSP